jgi:hypothetical protein
MFPAGQSMRGKPMEKLEFHQQAKGPAKTGNAKATRAEIISSGARILLTEKRLRRPLHDPAKFREREKSRALLFRAPGWALPPFTRVASWGRESRALKNYLKLNREEAAGIRPLRKNPAG